MILQDDPTQVSRDVERVLARDEFRYDPSWFERMSEWIGRQIDKLLGEADPQVPATATFGGGVGSVVAWLLVVAALAAMVAVVVYAVRRRVRRAPNDDGDELVISIEHRRLASDWAGDAVRLEAAGDWKGALRARYRELVRTLVDRRQLPDVAGRTCGELRQDLGLSTPDAAQAFDRASSMFELGWYAHMPVEQAEYDAFREAAAAVLVAPVREKLHASEGRGGDAGTSIEVHA